MGRIERSQLQIDSDFVRFIEDEALPGTGVNPDRFWAGLAGLAKDYGPANRDLLARRESLQSAIDEWHRTWQGRTVELGEYKRFLDEIGYLAPEGPPFQIETTNIDPEIASIAGPQLVVPVTNARFALNAANARWNSLYDALYGTDALGSLPEGGSYDPERGAKAVAWTRNFLDEAVPLSEGSHSDAEAYLIVDGELAVSIRGKVTGLAAPGKFVGFNGDLAAPSSVLLRNNGLHIDILIDKSDPVGVADRAGVCDVHLEAAVTTIVDCEDSVAVVDAEDKILAYRNWMGLMKGDLEADIEKGGRRFARRLREDRSYLDRDGTKFTLKGRSLLLVRNVGLLTTFPVAVDEDGNEIGEGLLDALCTTLIAMHDLNGPGRNSDFGSIYVVKPKLHGPEETAFTDAMFGYVESVLGLPKYTVKIGIMDEERRTSVNLGECIRAARHRVAFINTGFLDRTGDEIHTSMEAGPFLRKADIKEEEWIGAYEDRNVDIGLACGLGGKAQIGKGMWAMPDLMYDMLDQKIGHPYAGANTAWVPSPTAATLHATHYHRVDVFSRQAELKHRGARASLNSILKIPLATGHYWSRDEIVSEVENNLQGILGYVVRWVDQGVGCSKVPDINGIGLMEDRATCRISSQHIANWLRHGIVDESTVEDAMKRMARVVDGQNAGDPNYSPMAESFDGHAFLAARDLVFKGKDEPSGYTEPILHSRRFALKQES